MDKEASWVGEEQKDVARQITGQIPPRISRRRAGKEDENRWVGALH